MKLFWMVMLLVTRKAVRRRSGLIVDTDTGEIIHMVGEDDSKEYNKKITAPELKSKFKGQY